MSEKNKKKNIENNEINEKINKEKHDEILKIHKEIKKGIEKAIKGVGRYGKRSICRNGILYPDTSVKSKKCVASYFKFSGKWAALRRRTRRNR